MTIEKSLERIATALEVIAKAKSNDSGDGDGEEADDDDADSGRRTRRKTTKRKSTKRKSTKKATRAKKPTKKEVRDRAADYLAQDDDDEGREERGEALEQMCDYFEIEKITELAVEDVPEAMKYLDALEAGEEYEPDEED